MSIEGRGVPHSETEIKQEEIQVKERLQARIVMHEKSLEIIRNEVDYKPGDAYERTLQKQKAFNEFVVSALGRKNIVFSDNEQYKFIPGAIKAIENKIARDESANLHLTEEDYMADVLPIVNYVALYGKDKLSN